MADLQSLIDAAEPNAEIRLEGEHRVTTVDITKPVRLVGEATIVQRFDDRAIQIGREGERKISPALHVKRGAHGVRINGLRFVTEGAFPKYSAGHGSYTASIIGHHCDDLRITQCEFRTSHPRGIFIHGGKRARIESNRFAGCGVTLHVGYPSNPYFFDDGPLDMSSSYSPIAPRVRDNLFEVYPHEYPSTVLTLSGCTDFDVSGNRVDVGPARDGQNDLRGIFLYCNDRGPGLDGVPLSCINGICEDNSVHGSFFSGIDVRGIASQAPVDIDVQGRLRSWGNTNRTTVRITHNLVRGDGIGIRLTGATGVLVHANDVEVAGSPLGLWALADDCEITLNRFVNCGIGVKARTIYSQCPTARRLEFVGNVIVAGQHDGVALELEGVRGLELFGNTFVCGPHTLPLKLIRCEDVEAFDHSMSVNKGRG